MAGSWAYCTLLVLDQTGFQRLLARNATLRAAVKASAERRGIPLEALNLGD